MRSLRHMSFRLPHCIGFAMRSAFIVGLLINSHGLAATNHELFIVWGPEGHWPGELTVDGGTFQRTNTYSFEHSNNDKLLSADHRRVVWQSFAGGQFDGIHFVVEADTHTVFHLKTPHVEGDFGLADFPADTDREILARGPDHFLIFGRGDPGFGPKRPRSERPIPDPIEGPEPIDAVSLPPGWWLQPSTLSISVSNPFSRDTIVRRVRRGDGRLYLQVDFGAQFRGEAQVDYGDQELDRRTVAGSLWLSLVPRIGRLAIEVNGPDGARIKLSAPTTLVETRGPHLYVNNAPFLVKGTLPRDMNEADAAYLKELGANTLRGWQPPANASPPGFMWIAMVGQGPSHICRESQSPDELHSKVAIYLEHLRRRVPPVLDSEYLLIAQLANEQGGSADPWSDTYVNNSKSCLDDLLAHCCNEVKALNPAAICGYSNNMKGYRAPRFLEVYEHNSFLDLDHSYSPTITTFAEYQGTDSENGWRPWVMSEFGANVYMPEAYRFGPQFPVLEKIHAWNYPHRWRQYLSAGVNGGTSYCLYDYDPEKTKTQVGNGWDEGFSQFGAMTFDRQPKLALWELWHLWRDFEIKPVDSDLQVTYVRDTPTADGVLTLEAPGFERKLAVADFALPESRRVRVEGLPVSFRWRLDYTTNGGLPMVATGAWPRQAEADMFLERLKSRETFPFLRELFDAQVISSEGRTDVSTLREMEREDGIVPVVLRKPNGVAYLTVFDRRRPNEGWYRKGVTVELNLRGSVVQVDPLSGEPNGDPVEVEDVSVGLRFKNLKVPYWPARYTDRAKVPIDFPVYRITPP